MKELKDDVLQRKLRTAWVRLSVMVCLLIGSVMGCRSHLAQDKPSLLWETYNQQQQASF